VPTPPPSYPNQYSIFTSYVGPDDPAVQTWVLPRSFAYGAATPSPPLNLPYLWTGAGNVANIAFANDDFVLKATSGGASPSQWNVVVTLQLTGKNAWNTKPASRATLRTNYLAFIAGAEALEIGPEPRLLVPGSTALIASSVTQYMPLPLAEVLLYGCGLETGIGTGAPAAVDVIPGMRLRSEPSVRQYLAPPNQSLSGYVSTGALEWITSTNLSSGTPVQAFDPFLATIAAPQVTPPPSPPVPVSGLIDLQQTGATFKYYRLIYPQNVIAGGSPGATGVATNVQITAANTLATLRASPAYTAWFFGRDVLVPEVAICLQLGNNSSPQMLYVPVGTTLTNLLERFTRWLPVAQGQGLLTLQRLALTPANQGTQGAQMYAQFIFKQPNTQVNDLRAFPVPLLPGDYVTIALGNA
jgi:hypothetical protein